MKFTFAKVISVFLGCIMLLGLLPFGAMALTEGTGTQADPYIVLDYPALRSLMANAPADETTAFIKLGADILSEDIKNDYSLTLTKEGQNVVLDLAGHSITRDSDITVDMGVFQAKNGVLTIKDSVGGGAVIAKGRIGSAIALTSTGLLEPDDGTVNIYGGSYCSYAYCNQAVYNECANLYIFGGSFKGIGEGYGIFAAAGRTHIYGGDFYAEEEGKAMYLGTDQSIRLFNLTVFGNIESNSTQNNLWQYIHQTGKVYVDNVELTDRTETYEFRGNVVEIKTEMEDKLEIFVDEPVDGNEITKQAWTPLGANYNVVTEYGENVVAWFDGDAFANGTFENNTAYRVRVYVQVDIPVMPDISAEVNGSEAVLEFHLEAMEGHRLYWIEYTFPEIEDPVLKNVDITINAPVGGEIINGGLIYSADKFDVLADWHTSPCEVLNSDYGNLNGKPAHYGTTCYATVFINANDIYKFASDTTVVINGQEYDFEWFAGENFPKYIVVQNVSFEISAVQTDYLIGDVDNNGKIEADDYIMLKRIFFGTANFENLKEPETALSRCDIDGDGEIKADDYILLKRAYFGTYKIK